MTEDQLTTLVIYQCKRGYLRAIKRFYVGHGGASMCEYQSGRSPEVLSGKSKASTGWFASEAIAPLSGCAA